MFRVLIILTCIFYLSNLSAIAQLPSNMVGSWQGYVIEEGRSNPYHVSVNLKSVNKGEKAGETWYKDYNCGGYLTFLGVNVNGIYIFKEVLTNKGTCIDNGYILVTIINGKFGYLWTHDDFDHQAKGFLQSKY